MRRRDLLAAVGASAWPLSLHAEQTGRVARIGYLTAAFEDQSFVHVFRQSLRRLGYVEEQNVTIEYRFANGDFGRLPQLAAELVESRVDLIVATPTVAVLAAKNATSTTPIVMMNVGDPVGLGLVDSLSRPAGNVTGLSFSVGMETLDKALGLFKEAAPNVRLVAVLSNPSNPAQPLLIKTLEAASNSLGLRLQLLESRGLDGFDEAFAAMASARADGLFVVPDAVFVAHRMRLAELAMRNKLPSMHHFRAAAEAGALMSYGSDLAEPFARAAAFVDKLLKGAKPSDLPVEQPTTFELVINLKTAKALGLTIPPTLLARADEVIE